MNVNKAVFLDRDGTINVDRRYVHKIDDFEYLPGVIDGLKLFQEAGYLLIIVTNQSGIARGFYSEHDYDALTAWMLQDLGNNGISISKVYMCPHLPDSPFPKFRKNCQCRKPLLGLFEQAIREFHIDPHRSIAIGDNERDLSLCQISRCRGYIIDPRHEKTLTNNKLVRVDSLFEAAVISLR